MTGRSQPSRAASGNQFYVASAMASLSGINGVKHRRETMLSNPKVGQLVRLAYAPEKHGAAQSGGLALHGQTGRVVIASRSRKARNHGVDISGRIVVIPAGQLQPIA